MVVAEAGVEAEDVEDVEDVVAEFYDLMRELCGGILRLSLL